MAMRCLLILLVLMVVFLFPKKEKYDMIVIVNNISQCKGTIELALFDDPEVFLQKNKSFRKYSKRVECDSLIIRLKKIPAGVYAISLYQDLNLDKECNLSFLGIPSEPYEFSKYHKSFLKKPTFKDCQFSVLKDETIHIKLIHGLP